VKIKSALITAASGSVGGLTASHNRGGLYFRSRSIPTNPNSPFQMAVRAHMGTLAEIWNGDLTQAQRDGWEVYGLGVPVIDVLGETRYLSGISHFCRSNVPRLQAGASRIDDAPSIYNLGDIGSPSGVISEAAQEIAVTFDNTKAWAIADGGHLLVFCSRPQSPSINYFKGPYRFAGKIDGAAVPPASPADIALPFAAVETQRVFYMIRGTTADGRLSLPFRGTITVAA
jgi:hypothetical protein